MSTLRQLFTDHIEWAKETFPDATSQGVLIHLKSEIKEVEVDIRMNAPKMQKAEEFADCLGCLLNAMALEGIGIDDLEAIFHFKLDKNKARKWQDNGDGSYSHIKTNAV